MQFMSASTRRHVISGLLFSLFASPSAIFPQTAPLDEAAIIRGVDTAVKTRVDSITSYTVTEHYVVYRGSDEKTPAAEMTVKTTYQQATGKSYQILSETGSSLIKKYVFDPLLENEKRINLPENRADSWFVSANYQMKLQPGGPQKIEGRDCYVLAITPHQKASNLIQGTIWVDTKDESIIQVQGTATKSVSMFVDPSQVERHYVPIDGFAQATHARAVSESHFIGRTVLTIDYSDYSIKLRNAN